MAIRSCNIYLLPHYMVLLNNEKVEFIIDLSALFNPVLSLFMTNHRVCNKTNRTHDGCHMWSRNCLHFMSTSVQPRC